MWYYKTKSVYTQTLHLAVCLLETREPKKNGKSERKQENLGKKLQRKNRKMI